MLLMFRAIGQNTGFAASISEIGYLLFRTRDMIVKSIYISSKQSRTCLHVAIWLQERYKQPM